MEYSAVSQPPCTPWSFIQRGTPSSMVAAQMTRVSPKATSTEPVACGAMPGVKETGRNWCGWRPSGRGNSGLLMAGGWAKMCGKEGGTGSSFRGGRAAKDYGYEYD